MKERVGKEMGYERKKVKREGDKFCDGTVRKGSGVRRMSEEAGKRWTVKGRVENLGEKDLWCGEGKK